MKKYVVQLLFIGVLLASRIPGLLPPNFSAVYGFIFCAAVFLRYNWPWWMPLLIIGLSDLGLGVYYHEKFGYSIFQPYLLLNYIGYASIMLVGRLFKPEDALYKLICGGVGGAILFYLITNTAAWFFNPFNNPEYTKDLIGWFIALTKGTAGYPPTWVFFKNTLLSSALFTGLFAGAVKLAVAFEKMGITQQQELAHEKEQQPSLTISKDL